MVKTEVDAEFARKAQSYPPATCTDSNSESVAKVHVIVHSFHGPFFLQIYRHHALSMSVGKLEISSLNFTAQDLQ